MALELITGSLSTTDIQIGPQGGSLASVKCGFARLSVQITRGSTSTTTFCSSGWVSELPGMKQAIFSIVGYAFKGAAWTDPLVWVTASDPLDFIATADTSCTLTMDANVFSDGVDLVAASNSSRSVDGRSTGPVTSAWDVI